ncbi:MAG: DUF881 domain-containing protein [Bacillus subtilis]|nr:DUF881 domain-containing protein [Bacillus subtilis]
MHQVAGLTPASGQGIIAKLDDRDVEPKPDNSSNVISNDGLVHSEDVLKIVNELKVGGAKAISINNQRLVVTTEITTSGNSILVNGEKLNPPYIIKAIGTPETLDSALKIRGGIVEYLEVFGIKITRKNLKRLKFPLTLNL